MDGIDTKDMYTATILSKEIKNGKLIVSVLFNNPDGSEACTETFETNQGLDFDWITQHIDRRLMELESLPLLHESIELGVYVPKTIEEGKKLYKRNAQLYVQYMDAARLGFIQSDYPKITELREWLRSNFKDEYLSEL